MHTKSMYNLLYYILKVCKMLIDVFLHHGGIYET